MESPFREHFNTNYVPTDAEIERIRAHLIPHENELARLESLIDDLIIQRNQIRDYIEPHRALISHPRRLPQDVVEQIFLACLPTHNAIMSAAEPPLLLGRLCSAWRCIAFGMPRLWASLHIPVVFLAESEQRKVAMVEWLERSAPLALTLSVECSDDLSSWDTADVPILDSLAGFSTRWRTIHISKMTTEQFLSQLAAVEAPLLANIGIAFRYDLDEDHGPQVLSSNLFRGNSASIAISGPALASLAPTTPFTWDHLTHLTLWPFTSGPMWHLTAESAYQLLTGCAQLKSLKVALDAQWPPPVNEPLLLPCLESLVILDLDRGALSNFVDHLLMPRLGHFQLTHNIAAAAIQMSSVTYLAHLGERSPLISDLGLSLIDFTRPALVATLQLFPHVVKLTIAAYPMPDHPDAGPGLDAANLLAVLTPSASTPHPCPTLEDLWTFNLFLDNGTIMDFLQKQLDYGTNLRRLQLDIWSDPPDVTPDVQPFQARGLEVSLTYTPLTKSPKPKAWHGLEE